MIVFCFTNAPPALAPHGAKKSLFGTNPICFGAPTGNTPFIFDSSASMINRGKIRRAEKLGLKIPFGVALNKKGKITTDAKQALQGTQLPIAGFKGSGLAWMVDILSGVLTGSSHGGKTKDPFDDFSGPQNVGHLFITINPNVFSGNSFLKEMKKNIKLIIHAAAQPSHDWAKDKPLIDFRINAEGTLNLLELTKINCPNAPFIFMSTNKVYGDNPNILPLVEKKTRWEIKNHHKYNNNKYYCRHFINNSKIL